MAYNAFRYFTEGKYRRRPLKAKFPLLLKIRNGDFEYSPYFREAIDNNKLYDAIYTKFMETSQIDDIFDRRHEAHQLAKMKRIKENKLMEVGINEENIRLRQLRIELEVEFGKDLWEKCLEKQRGKGTTEDMYWWYKTQVKMSTTPSEIAIALGRTTTKGLR
tara:strand:+ start:372 stop:857 length:486 start_codon:yes stop_codon:yes gene_type:complete